MLKENANRLEQLSSWRIAQREYSLDFFLWEYARRRHGLHEQPPPPVGAPASGSQPRTNGCVAVGEAGAAEEEDELRTQLRRHIYQVHAC